MTLRRVTAGAAWAAAVAALLALGVWQLHRRAWKLALIAQVDRRLAAAPVAAPGPAGWAGLGPDAAYTRVVVRGRYLAGRDTRVQAVTPLGGGFWLMTPFATDRGFVVLVNRGFVPAEWRGAAPPGPATVAGLLRPGEPGGGFLRLNDSAHDRWYSRDVAAIAARRGLGRVAPYFIDADARTSPGRPRGGLTAVAFPNNHLAYALTWFAMAIGLAGAGVAAAWPGVRRRR